jgi:deazaflavin-dependent oxidoreductase (nitroreductase family)
MADPTSRPWWKHPSVRWIAAAVAVRLAGILLFRSRRPTVLHTIRQANKRVLNPLMLHLAGHRHWYAARLEHVGRRSGRRYATPVVAQPVEGGFAIPLPYGTDVDWRRNLQAAGSGVLQVGGTRHTIRDPRVAAVEDVTGLPPYWRALSRVYGMREWLLVSAAAEQPSAAAPAIASAGTSAPLASSPVPAAAR